MTFRQFVPRMTLVAGLLLMALSPAARAGELTPESKAVYDQKIRPFLQQHCFECHDAGKAKAGLRLDDLSTDFLAGKTADMWKEVIDHINTGDMPPEDKPRPDPKKSFELVEWVGQELKRAEREARMAGGRVLIRRLNRSEYANTVRDLLYLDENFVRIVEGELPGDGKAEGFDRIGSALLFDDTQLSTYIRLAGQIAGEAIVESEAPPAAKATRMDLEKHHRPPKPTEEIIQYQKDTAIPSGPGNAIKRADGVEFIEPTRFGDKGEFGHIGSTYNALPGNDSVPRDGYYRIRIRAGAFAGKRGTPVRVKWTYAHKTPIEATGEVEIKGTLDEPEVVETVVFLRQVPEGAKPSLRFGWNGLDKVIIPEPELNKVNLARLRATQNLQKLIGANAPAAEIEAAKKQVEQVIADARAFAGRPGAVARIYNPALELDEIPRLFIDYIEFEGPVEPQWPPKSHASLFPGGMRDDPAQVREVFARLLPRAYRRPVAPAEIDHAVAAVDRARQEFGMNHVQAMRYGLQTVLSSPDFLMAFEPSPAKAVRKLNDYELASRLSYFLWSSMPDDELFALAAKNQLSAPNVLRQQVRRMVASPKSREFVENFAGQWLHVRDFESVQPANEYKDYDDALKAAGHEEPYAFFQAILKDDLSILNFLDSDFLVINERLAKFYGIDGVTGDEFRRVRLPKDHARGGVLTMAGLLTYLADGTRTLPVRRGAWILEEMFNDPPPPPPPNAGEIQPNVSGQKLSVRQRLEMHRTEPTCASCHAKIDPLGLALENFDAIGAWRDRQNGEGIRGPKAPEIDASGTLPSGRAFATPDEFKGALLAEKDRFATAFTQKMLTYALGRPVGYVDRQTVERLVADLQSNDYRIGTLIEAIVLSEPFRTK